MDFLHINSNTITVCENSNSFGIGVWCNGNTSLFGGGIIGSSPITPTDCFSYG